MGQIISASEKTKEKQDNGETRAHSILPVPLRKNLDKRATEPVKSAIIDGWATNALEKVIGAARNDSELSLFDKRASVLIRVGNDKDEQEILKASVIGAITDETRKNPNLSKLILKENIDKQTGYGL